MKKLFSNSGYIMPGFKRSSKKRTFRKKSTMGSKTTIKALAAQVKALQKKTAVTTERDQYYVYDSLDTVAPYASVNLCNYANWTQLWPSTGTPVYGVRSSMYHRYMKIDNLVTLDNVNNEEGTINFTYMIVSRRDTAGTATDTGNSLSLTENVDFISSGLTFMNLKKWKVHFVKRFTLTQMDIAGDGQDSSQCQKRFTATIKVGKKITAPDGHWKSLTNSPDPSDTYYALLFNNNSAVDLESPRWTINCLHSIDN